MSLEEAAKAVALNTARGKSGAERLKDIEDGKTEVSRQQLTKMAEKYRRPLVAFYMSSVPTTGERGEDFRRAPNTLPPDFNPRLDALIRNVRARHDVVRFLLEDDEIEPHSFVGSASLADGATKVAEKIVSSIGFELSEYRRGADVDKAFAYLRNCLERSGIFVMLLGDLGSHHSKIEPRSFRGYAIADKIAPFIVINDNDARSAWSFTALHEAAHIWLGQTGISGASHEVAVERFCNDVAGLILLPATEIRALTLPKDFSESLAAIGEFSSERNVSRTMVAYLLFREKQISSARYREFTDHFYGAWLASKEKKKEKDERRINRYVVLRHRLGPALVGLAKQSLDSGSLSPTKASSLLGVKPGAVRTFLHPEGTS